RAFIQSGALLNAIQPDQATASAEALLQKLGMTPAQVNDLQSVPVDRLMLAARDVPAVQASMLTPFGGPVIDGRAIMGHPFDPTGPAVSKHVPVVIGTTKDEFTILLAALDPSSARLEEADLQARAGAMLGAQRGPAAIDLYKKLYPNTAPNQRWARLMTDSRMWGDSIRLAERKHAQQGAPVYMYRFDFTSPAFDGRLGAPHTIEIPFVFRTLDIAKPLIGASREVSALSQHVSTAWTNFARTGNPSQRGLEWPAYDPTKRATMMFDVATKVVNDPDAEVRRFWVA
ncbi:MAG: carboxylesterase family protein, partial [Steroidobacteraceae bacterium]